MNPEKLREKYSEFFYKNFSFKWHESDLYIWYDFLIHSLTEADLNFQTKIVIKNVSKNRLQKIKKETLENLIFHLGLIEMLNYWKLTSSPKIIIEAGNLEKEGKLFLRKIILNGMGQYFYENNIDFTKKGFLLIKTKSKTKSFKKSLEKLNSKKILIPIGGGKDSPTVIEILKRKGNILGGFILNPRPAQTKIAKIAKLKEIIIANRQLDPLLFKLNQSKRFLNGHVPFSAFLTFLSLIIAYIFDYGKIAFGWERSANEPNLKFKGRWINHQWSKSSSFENSFKNYMRKYLIKNVDLFSPLRNFSEIEIMEIFSKLPKYHSVFLSCNKAYKIKKPEEKWCGKCAKCLFVFASLYPFLDEEKLKKIFQKNLFEDKTLLPLMKQLIGKEKFKPFECVGTKKDAFLAFWLSLKKAEKNKRLPFLLNEFKKLTKK